MLFRTTESSFAAVALLLIICFTFLWKITCSARQVCICIKKLLNIINKYFDGPKNANELESKLEPLPFICQLRRFACKFNGQALDSRTLGGYGRQVQTSLNQAFVFSVFSRNQVKTKPLTWRSLPVSQLRGSSFAIISAHVQGPGPGPEFKFSKTVEVGWSC